MDFHILCILKHVEDVKDRSNTPCCMLHALCRIMSKMSKILKQAITDFHKFISLLLETLKMCMNYNIDSNMKSSNYSEIRFKPLIYFELQQSSN